MGHTPVGTAIGRQWSLSESDTMLAVAWGTDTQVYIDMGYKSYGLVEHSVSRVAVGPGPYVSGIVFGVDGRNKTRHINGSSQVELLL